MVDTKVRFYNFATTFVGQENKKLDTVNDVIEKANVIDVDIVHTSKLDNGDMNYTIAVNTLIGGGDANAKVSFERITVDLTEAIQENSLAASVPTVANVAVFQVLVSKNNKEAIYDIITFDYTQNH